MAFLSYISVLFDAWPGNLVYHLVVVLAAEALFGLAISQRDRRRDGDRAGWPLTRRVMWASLGLTLGQAVLILAVVLAGTAGSALFLPPLERLIGLAELGWLVWAFTPMWGRSKWPTVGLCIANPLAGLVMYALLSPGWGGLTGQAAPSTFNAAWQDILWSGLGILLASLALGGLLLGRPGRAAGANELAGGWGQVVAAFGFILAGHFAHLFLDDPALSATGWLRLSLLTACPLLLVAFYQHTLIKLASAGERPNSGGAWPLVETLYQASQALEIEDQSAALRRLADLIANDAGLQSPAVAFGRPGDSPENVDVPAIRRPGLAATGGQAFRLDAQPEVKRAIARKQGMSVNLQAAPSQALSDLLGLSAPGMVWIEPLVYARQTMGVLALGKTDNDSSWTPEAQQVIRDYAAAISQALYHAQRFQEMMRANQANARQLDGLQKQLSQSQADAQARLEMAQANLQRVEIALNTAQRQLAQQSRRVDDLVALVQLQNDIVQQAQHDRPEAERWSSQQLSDLLRERAELKMRVNDLQQALEAAGRT